MINPVTLTTYFLNSYFVSKFNINNWEKQAEYRDGSLLRAVRYRGKSGRVCFGRQFLPGQFCLNPARDVTIVSGWYKLFLIRRI